MRKGDRERGMDGWMAWGVERDSAAAGGITRERRQCVQCVYQCGEKIGKKIDKCTCECWSWRLTQGRMAVEEYSSTSGSWSVVWSGC